MAYYLLRIAKAQINQ